MTTYNGQLRWSASQSNFWPWNLAEGINQRLTNATVDSRTHSGKTLPSLAEMLQLVLLTIFGSYLPALFLLDVVSDCGYCFFHLSLLALTYFVSSICHITKNEVWTACVRSPLESRVAPHFILWIFWTFGVYINSSVTNEKLKSREKKY